MRVLSGTRDVEYMATFASPSTGADSESLWATGPLGKAQRELRIVMEWRTASDVRPPWEEFQRHGEEVKAYGASGRCSS